MAEAVGIADELRRKALERAKAAPSWQPRADLSGAARRFARLALEELPASQETYTMRRSYYRTIPGLYYLYDDFNDRRIHVNHALQMAGMELSCLLVEAMGRIGPDEKAGAGQ